MENRLPLGFGEVGCCRKFRERTPPQLWNLLVKCWVVSEKTKEVLPSTLQLDDIMISNLTNSIHTVFENVSIAKMRLDRNIVVQ